MGEICHCHFWKGWEQKIVEGSSGDEQGLLSRRRSRRLRTARCGEKTQRQKEER